MIEIWKHIKGHEGLYQVSNLGRVKSLERKSYVDGRLIKSKILKTGLNNPGYKFLVLRKNDISKNRMVHRLVAETFLSNPNSYYCVNHIDGNKQNNKIDNLEWCTQKLNLRHAIKIGLVENQCKITRKVTVKYNEKIIIFETMKDCAAYFGFKKGWLHNQIRKHGCTFNYKSYEIEVHERGVA
ncbi:hypothetical protein JOC70_000797 [Clostridium pascui]|uniref:NUMOD4 domain-containing protein n=1 Tax=Clostridium pascui TaxID=46609 RepID=UPI00195EA4E6|nr:NUMOD4 domain-containing protein [Clostridium pascui]MBM7869328.1 hypothetical protein [Clostridium pascui]